MCPPALFQVQSSAGDPPLPVPRSQQGQLHPQQWLCLLPRQHPQALAARPGPQLSLSGGAPKPVPVPRASVHPALPPGGVREFLTAPLALKLTPLPPSHFLQQPLQ